jgi:hypothetical protein
MTIISIHSMSNIYFCLPGIHEIINCFVYISVDFCNWKPSILYFPIDNIFLPITLWKCLICMKCVVCFKNIVLILICCCYDNNIPEFGISTVFVFSWNKKTPLFVSIRNNKLFCLHFCRFLQLETFYFIFPN